MSNSEAAQNLDGKAQGSSPSKKIRSKNPLVFTIPSAKSLQEEAALVREAEKRSKRRNDPIMESSQPQHEAQRGEQTEAHCEAQNEVEPELQGHRVIYFSNATMTIPPKIKNVKKFVKAVQQKPQKSLTPYLRRNKSKPTVNASEVAEKTTLEIAKEREKSPESEKTENAAEEKTSEQSQEKESSDEEQESKEESEGGSDEEEENQRQTSKQSEEKESSDEEEQSPPQASTPRKRRKTTANRNVGFMEPMRNTRVAMVEPRGPKRVSFSSDEPAKRAKVVKGKKEGDNRKGVGKSVVLVNAEKSKKRKKDEGGSKGKSVVAVPAGAPKKEKKSLIEMKKEHPSINCRSRPKQLVATLATLSDAQKKVLTEMGFGRLMEWKVDSIPTRLPYWIMENFNAVACTIKLNDSSIRIVPDDVETYLGFSRGTKKIDLEECERDEELHQEFRAQFGVDFSKATNVTLENLLKGSKAIDEWFKSNIVVLICSTVIESTSNGQINTKILDVLRDTNTIAEYDWCDFVLNVLVEQASPKNKSASYFNGPILLLLAFLENYLDEGRDLALTMRKFMKSMRSAPEQLSNNGMFNKVNEAIQRMLNIKVNEASQKPPAAEEDETLSQQEFWAAVERCMEEVERTIEERERYTSFERPTPDIPSFDLGIDNPYEAEQTEVLQTEAGNNETGEHTEQTDGEQPKDDEEQTAKEQTDV